MSAQHEKLEADLKKALETKVVLEKTLAATTSAEDTKRAQDALDRHLLMIDELRAKRGEILATSHAYTAMGGGEDLNELSQAYTAAFGNSPFYKNPMMGANGKPLPNNSRRFVFESKEQASSFFKEQAKTQSFLCTEEGKGFSGHNFYSLGNGELYQGSVAEITKQLNDSLQAAGPGTPAGATIKQGLANFEKLTKSHKERVEAIRSVASDSATPNPTAPRPKPPGSL